MVRFNKGTNNFNSRLKYDPIENDPKVSEIILKSEIQAEALLREKGVKRQLGYCHILWGIKQKILKENPLSFLRG